MSWFINHYKSSTILYLWCLESFLWCLLLYVWHWVARFLIWFFNLRECGLASRYSILMLIRLRLNFFITFCSNLYKLKYTNEFILIHVKYQHSTHFHLHEGNIISKHHLSDPHQPLQRPTWEINHITLKIFYVC